MAGSVSFFTHMLEAEGVLNGKKLDNPGVESLLSTDKFSHTALSMLCYTAWDNHRFGLSIPDIPLQGVRYYTTFSDRSNDAEMMYNNVAYTRVYTNVKGWIRLGNGENLCNHDFEISIECRFGDNELQLFLKNADPL